jgi:hypothetical protein
MEGLLAQAARGAKARRYRDQVLVRLLTGSFRGTEVPFVDALETMSTSMNRA